MTVSRSASVDELGKPLRVVRDARRGDDDRVVVREEEERPATVIGDTLATTRPEPRRRAMFETLPALPATSADVVDPIVHAAPLMISPSIEDPKILSIVGGSARSCESCFTAWHWTKAPWVGEELTRPNSPLRDVYHGIDRQIALG
jgi:hypothetical protein